jgi:hypothetical protein
MLSLRIAFVLLVFCGAATAFGRIGETADQFSQRYGAPRDTPASKAMDKNMPLLEGAIQHVYEYQGWRIRAAFLQVDGPAVRVEYQKIISAGVKPSIQDYELQAIMTANTLAGMSWTQTAYDNPDSPNKGLAKALESFVAIGQKMWRRTDGAILWLRGLSLRLELPIAREYEAQLKADKEQKARASVPKF